MPRLELVECSLRHGQQALLVSRLRQRHAVRVAEQLAACGFAALDVFGGSTFEAQLRFLGEDPWERLRAIRAVTGSVPLQASLAGQSLVGHRHAPDDVVESFIRLAAEAGIDIFRLHDPLNDVTNLERAVKAVLEAGKTAEGVVVYTDTDNGRLAKMATALAKLGCARICLADPLGLLGAARAAEVVTALRKAAPEQPLSVSFSCQTGQADFAYRAAADAGASRADVCLSPLSGGLSLPAAEALVAGLAGTDAAPELSLDSVLGATERLEESAPLYADLLDLAAIRLDPAALRGMVPVTAMGRAVAELRERDSLDRLGEVEQEITKVRAELGHPPLVSPLTAMIATQAVFNVCDGDRYATVSQEVKDYCLGLYGRPPEPIDAEVRRVVNGREEPITCRPADLLEPALPAARKELQREGVEATDEAAVGQALFGADWVAFARGEAEVELLGDEPAPEPAAAPESAEAPAAEGGDAEVETAPPVDVRELQVEVDGQSYTVRVFGAGLGGGGGAAPAGGGSAAATAPVVKEGTVVAPMQGLILKVNVKKGDSVQLGQVVAVLEAMKMQNDITATRAGTVEAVYVQEGTVVSPKDPILHIG